MSDHADPNKAYVWLDGDGYRAPAGTLRPDDPFADNPVTGAIAWDAFGGIETGWDLNPTRDIKPKPVWNRRKAPYKVVKGPTEERVKLKLVDYSVASVLTALQGGSIIETPANSGVFEWHGNDDEDFAILLIVRDDGTHAGFYSPRVTLTTPPPRSWGKEDLDGFEIELLALEPFIPITSWNPLWVSFTVAISASTAGTFTLTVTTAAGSQTTAGIAFGAAPSAVKSALEALSNVGTGNAVVTGSSGGPWAVTIKVPCSLSGSGTGLTPSGTVTVS